MIVGWIVLGAGLLGAALMVAGRLQDRHHSVALGLSYLERAADTIDKPFIRFELFRRGWSRYAQNLMHGTIGGREVAVFDYRDATPVGRTSLDDLRTVAAIHLPGANLAGFQITRESLSDKTASLFGYQDIDFKAYPKFSMRILLRGRDEASVRRLFNEKVIAWFEAHPEVFAEGGGEWLVVYRADEVPAAEMAAFIEEARELCTVLTGTVRGRP